ncbi:MAG: bifunctional phosphoribosylaminoimidazolecarboxamide formyltransferase/IMP cyclohydrolase, partial [Planctomycetota bacterium]|nr:bifunctional phosphoribosylaminoimidazolecarboxamide formyltransferase/IMP cyclohydrolase [Planctomycetota bacterium]
EFAAAAFSRTAEYDSAIASFLSRRLGSAFPESLRIAYVKATELRYGENPHQDAALYRDPASTGPTIVNSRQLHGKPLSYNNILDASSALELAKDLRRLDGTKVGAVVVKHTNACGAATADTSAAAVEAALKGDPLAAYGGILVVNRKVDKAAAEAMTGKDLFLEVVAAPDFDDDALEVLKSRWVNVRVLAVGDRAGSSARKLSYRSVPGGMLVQDRDTRTAAPDQWEHAAGPAPDAMAIADAAAVWTMCKHLNSNAIAIGGRDGRSGGAVRLFGAGAGERDRMTACRVAVEKAGANARGAIAASDAYFPFPDGPQILIDAGVTTLVHPGGSKRDQETFDLCDQRGVTCLVTGVRHFKH